MHLKDTMAMYGIYNTESLDKLIAPVHHMHNITTPNEKLFAEELNSAYSLYVNK